jgi:hypothetical protein
MADPLIYPPRIHLTFAKAFAERAKGKAADAALGDDAAAAIAERAAVLALYELALCFQSLACSKLCETSARNDADLS